MHEASGFSMLMEREVLDLFRPGRIRGLTDIRKGTNMKQVMVIAVVMVLVIAVGCATGPKGPTDEELVAAQALAFSEALMSKDLDGVMATVSEDFYHPEVGDKEALKDMVGQAIDAGYFDDGEMDMEGSETVVEGDTATVYPIVLSSGAGSVTIGLSLKKGEDGWMIVELDVEGA